MNRILFNRYPGGRRKALTMSYDDGQIHDRRLVKIFNKYKIKGTFHISSQKLGQPSFVNKEEIKELYKGHEVSVHSSTHPSLLTVPIEAVVREISDDKKTLEALVGYPVRGMSYPYGLYNQKIVDFLPMTGMTYARTVFSNNSFILKEDFMTWHPTCHHRDNVVDKAREFLLYEKDFILQLMYVWGHSYEFDRNNNWEVIEEFCQLMSSNKDIWYATNIEIVDYVNALRALQFTSEQDIVFNPTIYDVWFTVNDETVVVKSGEMKHL